MLSVRQHKEKVAPLPSRESTAGGAPSPAKQETDPVARHQFPLDQIEKGRGRGRGQSCHWP